MRKHINIFLTILLALLLLPLSLSFAQTEEDSSEYEFNIEEYEDELEEQDGDWVVQEYDWSEFDGEDGLISENTSEPGITAFLAATSLIIWIVTLVLSLGGYIFMALALSKIGKELKYKNSWFAWIPLLNMIMIMQLGEKSAWLILVPIVNLIMLLLAFMRITERRGYDKVLGLIVLTGIGTYVLLYLLAWKPKTDNTPTNTSQPSLQEQIAQEAATTVQEEESIVAQQPPTPTQGTV